MTYDLQISVGPQTFYELWAQNINGTANVYELWAPNIDGLASLYELL